MTSAKRVLRLAIGFAISAVLIVLLVRGVDPRALQAALTSADLRFLPLAIGLYFVAVYVRARRWKLLLPTGMVSTGILYQRAAGRLHVQQPAARPHGRGGPHLPAWPLAQRALRHHHGQPGRRAHSRRPGADRSAPGRAASSCPRRRYLLGAGLLVGAIFTTIAVVLALAAWNRSFLLRTAAILTRPLPARVQQTASRVLDSFVEGLPPGARSRARGRPARALAARLAVRAERLLRAHARLFHAALAGRWPW